MSNCCSKKNKKDKLFIFAIILMLLHFIFAQLPLEQMKFVELWNVIEKFIVLFIPGVIAGIVASFIIEIFDKKLLYKVCGKPGTIMGVVKSSFAGIVLDVCNHGVLIIAAKLYSKGLRISQVMAFLISTPWNSFTAMFVMVTLMGALNTMFFVLGSFVISILTGILFLYFENREIVKKNEVLIEDYDENISFTECVKESIEKFDFGFQNMIRQFIRAIIDSKMIVKWLLIGVIIAAYIEIYVDANDFKSIFAPTIIGMVTALGVAAIIEVCSEGTMPVASQMITIAGAKGNAFVVLMGGVATDYTEFAILRDMTSSIRVPILMMLITIPQILLVGYILNIL